MRKFKQARVEAYFIDLGVIYGCGRLLIWAGGLFGSANLINTGPSLFVFLTLAVMVRLPFCLKDGFYGTSPGKWFKGLMVVDVPTGLPIGFAASFKRNLWLLLPLIGEVIILVAQRNGLRPGDHLAQTRVVYRKLRFSPPFAVADGLCHVCGYPRAEGVSVKCSECGTRLGSRPA